MAVLYVLLEIFGSGKGLTTLRTTGHQPLAGLALLCDRLGLFGLAFPQRVLILDVVKHLAGLGALFGNGEINGREVIHVNC